MTIHSLELNDSAISLFQDTQLIVKSPGFTVIDGKQIFMGTQAQERARLLPKQLNHRYWSQLNLNTMSHPLGQWHRHADIAHAHLQAISEQADNPKEIILAVPGSYQSEQLALLLGMCRECPFDSVGLVDSALAGSVLVECNTQKLLHLDLQLHQAVVTHFDVVNSTLQRTAVVPLPGLGLQTFYDGWARYIAAECIHQTRFDPMHTALAEQQLYNELNHWLEALQNEQEINVQLQGQQLRLNRQQLLASSEASYKKLLAPLYSPNTTIVLSHRVAMLPGFSLYLTQPVLLPIDAVAQGITRCAQSIRGDQPELEFITALLQPNSSQYSTSLETELQQNITTQATHVLWKHTAYPLIFNSAEDRGEGFEEFCIATKIPANKTGLLLEQGESTPAVCYIVRHGEQLSLHIEQGSEAYFSLQQLTNKKHQPWTLNCGDQIRWTGSKEELVLIQVRT